MVTNDNDEIKQKASEKEWDYSASFKDKADDYENYLMNEARADTAKQIFADLENIKDEYGNSLIDTLYGKGEQYKALKKKYNIEE
jgi:hypothetical protein